MNILFLTLIEIKNFDQTGIYPDLINEFAGQGHDIYVVNPCEYRNKKNYTLLREKGNIHLVSALIPDYFGVGFIRKGISSVFIEKCYIRAIEKAIRGVRFDLIIYSTPPITFCGVIEKFKKRDNAVTYLLLKDIWPQGPIDIGALSTSGVKGVIVKQFRSKERRLYAVSDCIGCMSEKNCRYIIENNGIEPDRVEICPNSIRIRDTLTVDREEVRKEYGIPSDKTVFVYGGNLGAAQGIDFIISCLAENEKREDTYILIVGNGTEYSRLAKWFEENRPANSGLMPGLPSQEYRRVMSACDVGLIFLDHRFTIPNFPSRLLSYMEGKMPVLAATDVATDIGEVILEGGFGYWCESTDPQAFCSLMSEYTAQEARQKMGNSAYQYLVDNYTVGRAYNIVLSHFI